MQYLIQSEAIELLTYSELVGLVERGRQTYNGLTLERRGDGLIYANNESVSSNHVLVKKAGEWSVQRGVDVLTQLLQPAPEALSADEARGLLLEQAILKYLREEYRLDPKREMTLYFLGAALMRKGFNTGLPPQRSEYYKDAITHYLKNSDGTVSEVVTLPHARNEHNHAVVVYVASNEYLTEICTEPFKSFRERIMTEQEVIAYKNSQAGQSSENEVLQPAEEVREEDQTGVRVGVLSNEAPSTNEDPASEAAPADVLADRQHAEQEEGRQQEAEWETGGGEEALDEKRAQPGSVWEARSDTRQIQREDRYLDAHLVEGQPNPLTIEVMDEPGSGGAHHRYDITGFDTSTNPSNEARGGYRSYFNRSIILFQNGPVPQNGANGITVEALLAICEDRLKCFQAGPFACEENQEALLHIQAALGTLNDRTRARIARQVEGQEVK